MGDQAHLKIKTLLSQHTHVGVIMSKNPVLDHAAAGLSLYLTLRQIGKQALVISPTAPTAEISRLAGIDNVKTSLDSNEGDLTVSFPYRDGEIEKVSYNLDQENNLLHIIVKAGNKGLLFHEKEIQFKRGIGKIPPLMFFIGVARLTDLGTLFNPDAFKDTTIINIDNRPENQGFGDIVLVSPKFSSISEQVAQLLSQVDVPDLNQDIAQNLLSGISHATKDFQDPKTSYLAFEMAGALMKKGAIRQPTVQKEEKQESSAAFFTSQQQRPQPITPQPRPQTFPKPQFPQPFQPQPVRQPQFPPVQQNQGIQSQQNHQIPPEDWLKPKIYKGPTVL